MGWDTIWKGNPRDIPDLIEPGQSYRMILYFPFNPPGFIANIVGGFFSVLGWGGSVSTEGNSIVVTFST